MKVHDNLAAWWEARDALARRGDSLGFAFIEFSSEAEATAAIQKANGYKLDKSHTFIVNSFDDYAKYTSVPDEEQEFTPPPYVRVRS